MELFGYPIISIITAVLFVYLGLKILKWLCWILAAAAVIIGVLMYLY